MSDGQVQPTRAARRRRARPPWPAIAVVAVVVIVVAVIVRSGGDDGTPAPIVRSPGTGGGPAEPTRLALVVTGGAEPLVAFVGSGGDLDPAAIVLPPALSMVVPGAGELEVRETALLPFEEMRMGLSNGVGTWAAEAARLDLGELTAALGDGTLMVNLPAPVVIGGTEVGPGEVELTGAQVREVLSTAAPDLHLRWQAIFAALLADPNQIPLAAEATDAQAAADVLGGAGGATPMTAPTEMVGGTLQVPLQPQFDRTVAELFGTPEPVPVEVRNGSGEPGAGGLVGEAIVRLGFRIVLSGNAESFDVQRTEITANGPEHQAGARSIRDALGTGSVVVSQVPSGVADVTVIIGSDLS